MRRAPRPPQRIVSHGTGIVAPEEFAALGPGVVLEAGVLVFHPERIHIGRQVYVGHYTILKGYHKNRMVLGDHCWIGQQCFLHSAGGLVIEAHAGLGPGVKIITSAHALDGMAVPIRRRPLRLAPVVVGEGSDIGVGAIILPGVRIGRGAQVAAGAVVADDVREYAVVGGVPARLIRMRR